MRGGYPDVVLAGSDEARRIWLEAYVDQVEQS
jgi:hypothetical protein